MSRSYLQKPQILFSMPTYRDDLHLGHKVPMVETDDIVDGSITARKIANRAIEWWHIALKAIRNEHIGDEAVDSRCIKRGAIKDRHIGKGEIHPNKFAPCVESDWLNPILNEKCRCMQKQLDELHIAVTAEKEEQL